MLHAPCFTLHSKVRVGQDGFAADPSTPRDLQSYDHILSVILDNLSKLELLVWDLPKPPDMVADLSKAFQEPSMTTRVMDAASAYKVLADLCNLRAHHCLKLLQWRRKWLNRSVISVPWPLILNFAEPWKYSLSRQWRPGGLDGT